MLNYLLVKGRTFVMGDLHGCYESMQQTLQTLAFKPEQGDVVLALGDLTDRGPDSVSCLRLLHQPWFHSIRGNHEQLMLTALLGQSPHARKLWFTNGGSWYEGLSATLQEEVLALCRSKVASLPYALEITTRAQHRVGLVHADPIFNHWQLLVKTLRAPAPDPELLEKLLWQRERLHHLRQPHSPPIPGVAMTSIKTIMWPVSISSVWAIPPYREKHLGNQAICYGWIMAVSAPMSCLW